jgi:sugar lactone lactonase YvrE
MTPATARAIIALQLLPVIAPPPVLAQAPTGIAAADSAAVARAAYQRGLRATDLATARKEIDRAAAAWPTQQTYVWARALLAARAGDTVNALAALTDYADLSLGRDLRRAPDLRSLASSPAFAPLEVRHATNHLPMVRSRVVATLADSSIWPEGMDHDPRAGTWYIASVNHRTVERVSATGVVSPHWVRDDDHVAAVLAVRVDTARNVLWATTSGMPAYESRVPGDSAIAAVLRIRLSDGSIERRWDLPVTPRGHVLGDIAIGPGGDVFISDSNEPVIYRLRPGSDVLEPTRSPLFNSAQGLAPSTDGRALYIADYSHGLIRMDLASGALRRLDDAPYSTSLGVDGLVYHRGSLIGIQNGFAPARVVRFYLDASGMAIQRAEIIDRNSSMADEPTIGTIVGNEFVYVANSQWEKRDAAGKPKPGVRLTGPILLGVPLK